MINLSHLGYEMTRSFNLTHPGKWDNSNFIEKLKWAILKQPRYAGRVYKTDQPDLEIWTEKDEYFTFYKGRGKQNKGDRMVCFYMKTEEITEQHKRDFLTDLAQEEEERNEPLY